MAGVKSGPTTQLDFYLVMALIQGEAGVVQIPVPGPETNGLSGAAMDTVVDGTSMVRVSRRQRNQ